MVRAETPNTSAISSSDMPAKNRISTTWHWRPSSFCNRASASSRTSRSPEYASAMSRDLRVFENEQVPGVRFGYVQGPIKADFRNTATALAGVALPGAIDQDLPHDMRGDLKEMGTVAQGVSACSTSRR